jgi:hypothetical protein
MMPKNLKLGNQINTKIFRQNQFVAQIKKIKLRQLSQGQHFRLGEKNVHVHCDQDMRAVK